MNNPLVEITVVHVKWYCGSCFWWEWHFSETRCLQQLSGDSSYIKMPSYLHRNSSYICKIEPPSWCVDKTHGRRTVLYIKIVSRKFYFKWVLSQGISPDQQTIQFNVFIAHIRDFLCKRYTVCKLKEGERWKVGRKIRRGRKCCHHWINCNWSSSKKTCDIDITIVSALARLSFTASMIKMHLYTHTYIYIYMGVGETVIN